MTGDSVDGLAKQHGVARRTLERRFRDETGMSFGITWRQKGPPARFDPVAGGRQVSHGYRAGLRVLQREVLFIAAFKGTFGYTPGRL